MSVFISHAAGDRKQAQELLKALRSRGIETSLPEDDLGPGDNWALKIGQALEQADAMVVLLSNDSAKSPWIQKEVEYAITSPRFQGRLIPVRLEKNASYPWILNKLQVVSFDIPAIVERLRSAKGRKTRTKSTFRHAAKTAA